MAKVKPGSWVRVQFEGELEENEYGDWYVKTSSGRVFISPAAMVTVQLPPEPPEGTVVTGTNRNVIYRRLDGGWYRLSPAHLVPSTWQEVVRNLGDPDQIHYWGKTAFRDQS